MLLLPLLARFWPYIAIALLTLGLYASVRHSGALSAQRDSAIQTANDNAAIAIQERSERKRSDDIAAKSAQAAEQSRQKHITIKRDISNAPATDDGPIAPVLRDQLNRLREPDHKT